MDLLDILGLLLIGTIVWLWLDSLKAREAAVAGTRTACATEGLLLLDDTVAIARIGMHRDGEGTLRVARTYSFEYTDTGNDRHPGRVAMVSSRVVAIELAARPRPAGTTLH